MQMNRMEYKIKVNIKKIERRDTKINDCNKWEGGGSVWIAIMSWADGERERENSDTKWLNDYVLPEKEENKVRTEEKKE